MPSLKWVRNSRFRLVLSYLVVFLLSVAVLLSSLFVVLKFEFEDDIRKQIEIEHNLLLFEYKEDGIEELAEEIEERIEKNPSLRQFVYSLISPDGRAIFDPLEQPPGVGWYRLGLQGDEQTLEPGTYLVVASDLPDGFRFVVGKNLNVIAQLNNTLWELFLWSGLITVFVGVLGGLWISSRLYQRVRSISQGAHRVSGGDVSHRIELTGQGDEFDEIASIFNSMLDRIEQLLLNQRQVTVNIAHDLRTPLSRLRNHLHQLKQTDTSISQQDLITSALVEVNSTLAMFDAMLRLAELESGRLKAGFVTLSLSDLVHHIATAFRPELEDQGHHLIIDVEPALNIYGDKQLISQMISNLLANAARHGGRALEIQVLLLARNGKVVLTISDNGCGIAPAEVSRLMKPFQKNNSKGYGLGLPLAAAIAQLHQATFELKEAGPGLCCEISFSQS